MGYMARYPPSGRSSVGRESEDDFLTSVANYNPTFKRRLSQGLPRSKSGSFRSGSVSPQSLGGWEAGQESPCSLVSPGTSHTVNIMNNSATSLESGFMDFEGSMTSSLCSMNTSISSQPTSQASNLTNTSLRTGSDKPVLASNLSNTSSSLLASFPPAPLSPVKECREPRSPAKIKCHLPEEY